MACTVRDLCHMYGRLFQTWGPATGKARSSTVDRLDCGWCWRRVTLCSRMCLVFRRTVTVRLLNWMQNHSSWLRDWSSVNRNWWTVLKTCALSFRWHTGCWRHASNIDVLFITVGVTHLRLGMCRIYFFISLPFRFGFEKNWFGSEWVWFSLVWRNTVRFGYYSYLLWYLRNSWVVNI